MFKYFSNFKVAFLIWITTSLVFGIAWLCFMIFFSEPYLLLSVFIATPVAALASFPVFIVMILSIPFIEKTRTSVDNKIFVLGLVCFASTAAYGLAGALAIRPLNPSVYLSDFLSTALLITGVLFGCALAAIYIHMNKIRLQFSSTQINTHQPPQIEKMETTQSQFYPESAPASSNKILIKGVITGVLILLMMIPTVFINNLVSEREARQKEVAQEVSSKWALGQRLAGPYIYLPYKTFYTNKEGKIEESNHHLWILPENLHVSGVVQTEIRQRSIYNVLLYRTTLKNNGNFIPQLPKNVDPNAVGWKDAKICFGLSDFKGIEEKVVVNFNGADYELSPGLLDDDLGKTGLSSTINLAATDLQKNIPFAMNLKIKGSGQLHFVPLSGNSDFSLQSGWNSPSFDGNNLPTERKVTENGFTAKWTFNKANLPFSTVLKEFNLDQNNIAFGVTLLEPADQYAKTNRSVKYAILFIGLTFSLFFIVELMQNRPVHPVQYILIGLGLVIFYTLLLSISEFILFDYAYIIASLATIMLISLYARSHFKNSRSAAIFGGILGVLYGFIFVLIRLEDTALLVGSVGLFIVLALVMYASRNINWYGNYERQPAL